MKAQLLSLFTAVFLVTGLTASVSAETGYDSILIDLTITADADFVITEHRYLNSAGQPASVAASRRIEAALASGVSDVTVLIDGIPGVPDPAIGSSTVPAEQYSLDFTDSPCRFWSWSEGTAHIIAWRLPSGAAPVQTVTLAYTAVTRLPAFSNDRQLRWHITDPADETPIGRLLMTVSFPGPQTALKVVADGSEYVEIVDDSTAEIAAGNLAPDEWLEVTFQPVRGVERVERRSHLRRTWRVWALGFALLSLVMLAIYAFARLFGRTSPATAEHDQPTGDADMEGPPPGSPDRF